MMLQYLSARTGANSRCGAAHILNLHPAGQNPKTLGNLLVADPPCGSSTEGERKRDMGRQVRIAEGRPGKHDIVHRIAKERCPRRLFCLNDSQPFDHFNKAEKWLSLKHWSTSTRRTNQTAEGHLNHSKHEEAYLSVYVKGACLNYWVYSTVQSINRLTVAALVNWVFISLFCILWSCFILFHLYHLLNLVLPLLFLNSGRINKAHQPALPITAGVSLF